MKKNLRLTTCLVGSTALSMTFITPAAGQDLNQDDGGLTLTYGISSSLRANDNIGLDSPSPGDSFLWDNELSFGLLKQTQVDTLTLDLSGILRLSDTPATSDGFDFDDQRIGFGYIRDGSNSRLSFDARYREADLSFTDPVRLVLDDINNDGVLDDQDLLVDDGTLRTTNLNFAYEAGINNPFGAGFELDYDLRRNSDTAEVDRVDTDVFDIEVFGRFTLSPVAEGRVVLGYEDFEEDDDQNETRTTQDVIFELGYDVSPVTLLEASLGYRDIEETTLAPITRTTESGVIASIGLTRTLVNGSAGVLLDTDLTISGRRTTLSFSRNLDLPTGSLGVVVGAAFSDGSDSTDFIGALEYIQSLPRGTFTAMLERESVTDQDGDDRVTSVASLGYETLINPSSSLLFELDYVMNDESLGAGLDRTTDAATFRATYIRELTQDWNLRTGYEYRAFDESDDDFADSNEIFLTLEREFSIRR